MQKVVGIASPNHIEELNEALEKGWTIKDTFDLTFKERQTSSLSGEGLVIYKMFILEKK